MTEPEIKNEIKSIESIDAMTDDKAQVLRYVERLKVLMKMNEKNPELLKIIKGKLNSLILRNREIFHDFEGSGGAGPDWVMNILSYNPPQIKG